MMYRLIDAEGYRGQKVLIVGGGDSAVEAAIGLAQQPDNEVTLSYRRDKLVRIKKKNQDRFAPLVAAGRIKPIFGSRVVEVLNDRVRLEVGAVVHELPNDYVFVFAGGEPPVRLPQALRRALRRDAGARPRRAPARLGRLARVSSRGPCRTAPCPPPMWPIRPPPTSHFQTCFRRLSHDQEGPGPLSKRTVVAAPQPMLITQGGSTCTAKLNLPSAF